MEGVWGKNKRWVRNQIEDVKKRKGAMQSEGEEYRRGLNWQKEAGGGGINSPIRLPVLLLQAVYRYAHLSLIGLHKSLFTFSLRIFIEEDQKGFWRQLDCSAGLGSAGG